MMRLREVIEGMIVKVLIKKKILVPVRVRNNDRRSY